MGWKSGAWTKAPGGNRQALWKQVGRISGFHRNNHVPPCTEMRLLIGKCKMTASTLLLIVLILLVVGAIPAWPHSRAWGYGPSGILGVVLVVLLILVLMGRV
jgi:hypothetical protein